MAVAHPGTDPRLGDLPAFTGAIDDPSVGGGRMAGGELDGARDAYFETRRYALRRLVAADLLGLLIAGLVGPLVGRGFGARPVPTSAIGQYVRIDLVVVPLFLCVFAGYGLYRGAARRIITSVFSDLRNIIHGIVVAGIGCVLLGYVVTKWFGIFAVSDLQIVLFCTVALCSVPAGRVLSCALADRIQTGSVPVIVAGTGKLAQTVASHLRSYPTVDFLGFVDDDPLDGGGLLGGLEDLPDLCERYGVARVVVCFSRTHPERTTEILRDLSSSVAVSIVPRYYELITARSHVEDLSGLPMLDIVPASLGWGARLAKRSLDLVVSSVLLLLLSPLLLTCGVIIRATSPGPVFFRQIRSGRGQVPFTVLKFRTMTDGAEERRGEIDHLNEVDGPLFKVTCDPRVTQVGRFLRKTSLDEIPQLINVWKGDMSLVGPRPFVVSEAAEIEGWAAKRFEARPGMTGLWQVSGRNELSHLELCRLDYVYVASWSFWWDMQILWSTPAAVLHGRGAS